MGLLEDKIKQDIVQSIFTDTLKIYENLDNKFSLTNEQKDTILEKITDLNKDLQIVLKDLKLS